MTTVISSRRSTGFMDGRLDDMGYRCTSGDQYLVLGIGLSAVIHFTLLRAPKHLAMSSGCRAMLIDGGGVTERVRGYRRKTNKLPYPHISKEFPGKIDTTTPYVIGKIVSRLEMDSRWAFARSVRALVAERDALWGKLETRQAYFRCRFPRTTIGWTGRN